MAAGVQGLLRWSTLPPLPSIRDIIRIYQLTARKQLSQNFLMDMNLTRKIVRQCGPLANANVCEVGPGPGGITRAILEQNPAFLMVVEKDRRFLPSLDTLAEATHGVMDIVHTDILNFDISLCFPNVEKRSWEDEPPNLHVIGNLPFNISTPLIIRWLEAIYERKGPYSFGRTKLTLTFQEEVGERMVAPHCGGQRCRLSVMCQHLADVKYKFTIPGRAFVPAPKVNVAVMTLEPLVEPKIKLPFKVVEKFMRCIFHLRNKYCRKGLAYLYPMELRKEMSDEVFTRTKVDSTKSCIQLTMEELGAMCHVYYDQCNKNPGLYFYDYRDTKTKFEDLQSLANPYPPPILHE